MSSVAGAWLRPIVSIAIPHGLTTSASPTGAASPHVIIRRSRRSRTQHRVTLIPSERRHLQQLVRQTTVSHFTYQRARLLLAADHRTDGPAPTDAGIARAVGVSTRSVARVRARWADVGVEATLRPADRGTRGRSRFDTATQARIVQLACSPPPPGHSRWSVRLLADQAIELAIVDAIAPESVRQVLKKTVSSPG